MKVLFWIGLIVLILALCRLSFRFLGANGEVSRWAAFPSALKPGMKKRSRRL